ncbi:MAG: hypothetical protein ACQESX_11155 [Bacteroidota bacterium]
MKQYPDINILLTFDYELPLGGISRSYDHSLFAPARRLLHFADELKVPLVFFADVLSDLRFSQKGITSFSNPFRMQLREAMDAGHDVQLHLHPHWLNTEVEDGRFFPGNPFRLGDFAENGNPDKIHEIVAQGVEHLQNIARKTDSAYRCLAYRGGGYNLEPGRREILGALLQHGLQYDSTIVPGYVFYSQQNRVDYRNVPDKPNWFLHPDIGLRQPAEEGLWEVPVASVPKRFFEMPTAFKMKKYAHRAPEERGRMIHSPEKLSFKEKWQMLMANRMLTVDNFTYAQKYLNGMFDRYIAKYQNYEEISLALIGHPKSMGNYAFELLEGLIHHIREHYPAKANFTTFRKLAEESKQEDS